MECLKTAGSRAYYVNRGSDSHKICSGPDVFKQTWRSGNRRSILLFILFFTINWSTLVGITEYVNGRQTFKFSETMRTIFWRGKISNTLGAHWRYVGGRKSDTAFYIMLTLILRSHIWTVFMRCLKAKLKCGGLPMPAMLKSIPNVNIILWMLKKCWICY